MWLTAPQALPLNPCTVSPRDVSLGSSMGTESYSPIVPSSSEYREKSDSLSSNNPYLPCSGFVRRKPISRKGCSSLSAFSSIRPPMFPIPWAGAKPIPTWHGSPPYSISSHTRGSKAAQWVKELFSKPSNPSSADFVATVSSTKLMSQRIPYYSADGEYVRRKTLEQEELWLPPVKLNTLRMPVQTNAPGEHPPLPLSPSQKGISPALEVTTRPGADKASMTNTTVPNSNDEHLMTNGHSFPFFSSEENFTHFPTDQTISEKHRSSSNISQFSGCESSSSMNSLRVGDWHPGFNYEANFSCYYNYYPADEYLQALPRLNEEDSIETHPPVEETNNSLPRETLVQNEWTLPPTPLSNNTSRKSSIHKTDSHLANPTISSSKKKKVLLETKNAKESGSRSRRQSSFSSLVSNKQNDRSGIKENKDNSAKTKTYMNRGRASRSKADVRAEMKNDESTNRNRRNKETQSSPLPFSPPPATNTTAATTSISSPPESFNSFNLNHDGQVDQNIGLVTTHADVNLRPLLKSTRRLRSCCNNVGEHEDNNQTLGL